MENSASENTKQRIEQSLREMGLSEPDIQSVVPQLSALVAFINTPKDSSSYWDWNTKVETSARLLGISKAEFVAAAQK